MSDLGDLYQDVILDHTRKPRNFGALPGHTHAATGHNPLCGDRLTLEVAMDKDRIADLRFTGSGCSIFKSSASIMTEAVKGKTRAEASSLHKVFHDLVTKGAQGRDLDDLESLAAFSGVSAFPVRVKCATLAWHTLQSILDQKPGTVTTEG